jgi:hypothetical protein
MRTCDQDKLIIYRHSTHLGCTGCNSILDAPSTEPFAAYCGGARAVTNGGWQRGTKL